MFEGTAGIVPINPEIKPFEVTGVWLYKPEFHCWYCNGKSFPDEIVNIKED
jgi:hypothetical protein